MGLIPNVLQKLGIVFLSMPYRWYFHYSTSIIEFKATNSHRFAVVFVFVELVRSFPLLLTTVDLLQLALPAYSGVELVLVVLETDNHHY